MMRRMLGWLAVVAVAASAGGDAAAQTRAPLTLEKVVLLYRHGVRAPLESEAAIDDLPHAPLPAWPVSPSLLTPHGAEALRRIGSWRRARFQRSGLWRGRCPAARDLAIWTNTAARTIASGAALANGLAPGCTVPIGHLADGQTDPLFEPMRISPMPFDGAAAIASVQAYTGGVAAMTARNAAALREMAHVLGCDRAPAPCDLAAVPATVSVGDDGRDVALTGPIRRYSGTAQVLLLEYLEGLPMAQVGWGRATPATLKRLAVLHAALFDVYARPPYMAARVAGPLALRIAALLRNPAAPKVSIFMGHDTNVAALSALLGVQVTARDYAPGDPPPGGALGIEVLRDGRGHRWARLFFESANPEQIRHLVRFSDGDAPARQILNVPGCSRARRHDLCPLATLTELIERRAVG